jgi:plastocyanin
MDRTSAREYYLDTDSLRSVGRSEPDRRITSDCRCGCESNSLTAPSAVPVVQPKVSAVAASGPEVKIVEPPFRQPQEWTYTPVEISVKLGTTVVWTNTGAVAHTVTADDAQAFDSGTIHPKATFTLTSKAAGRFAYHCTFHPWMKATLVVSS